MSLANIKSWNVRDPHAGLQLESISRVSDRAISLINRNRANPILKTGFINIFGSVGFMSGLDYHAESFSRICRALGAGDISDSDPTNHEAVAYINRVGQFYAFANSDFVKQRISGALEIIPSLARIMIFRNKHTAHRSIDDPRREEPEEHWRHAQSLGNIGGRIFTLRPGVPFEHPVPGMSYDPLELQRRIWEANYLAFNTYDAERKVQVNFTLELEHPTIMGEAYHLLETLLLMPA